MFSLKISLKIYVLKWQKKKEKIMKGGISISTASTKKFP